MRLELGQLKQAREACAEEAREMDRAITRAENHLKRVREMAERIRKDGNLAVRQAKTWSATCVDTQRQAMEKLHRLEKEGRDAHCFEEPRLFHDKMEAQRAAAAARVAASQAGITPDAIPLLPNVAGWEKTAKTLERQLERLQAEGRERARDISEQRQRIDQCARAVTESQIEIHRVEQEAREAFRKAEKLVREAQQAIAEAYRRRDEARDEFGKIGKALDRAEELLRAYERTE